MPDTRAAAKGKSKSKPMVEAGIEIGNENTPAAATLNTFTQVQSSDSVAGSTTFDVTSHATGRYVLIWITYLPRLAGSSNRFEAMIYNIVVHGSPVSQSG